LDISEEELVKGCLTGAAAFQRMLYKRYAAKMLTVCLRYTDNREEAEDILHEGFIIVFDKLHQFKMQGSFEGWIRRIMVNKCIEAYRKKARIFPVVNMGNVKDVFISPEEILSSISTNDLLAMIQELPPMYKQVFNLYVFEGMLHKEIAQALNITEGTSKSNLFDARAILKKKIKQSMIVAQKIIYENEQQAS
jgi:RNA polymerase sigma-70 factor (ECF subfamily)